jgi:hypothetical protein
MYPRDLLTIHTQQPFFSCFLRQIDEKWYARASPLFQFRLFSLAWPPTFGDVLDYIHILNGGELGQLACVIVGVELMLIIGRKLLHQD